MIRTLQLTTYIALFFTAGCQSTRLETTWRSAEAESVLFRKVAVVVLNGSPGERRAVEDEIVNQVRSTPAVASYTFVSETDLPNRNRVVELIRQHNCDGAIVLRLIAPDKPASYVPGKDNYFLSTTDYTSELPRATPRADTVDAPVRAETSYYSTVDGKLLWAGSSSARAPVNARDLATKVARESAAELRRQALLW
jgi:hypothetical protein